MAARQHTTAPFYTLQHRSDIMKFEKLQTNKEELRGFIEEEFNLSSSDTEFLEECGGLISFKNGEVQSYVIEYVLSEGDKFSVTSVNGLTEIEQGKFFDYIHENSSNSVELTVFLPDVTNIDLEQGFSNYKKVADASEKGLEKEVYVVLKESPIGIELRVSSIGDTFRVDSALKAALSRFGISEVYRTSGNQNVYTIKNSEEVDDFLFAKCNLKDSKINSYSELVEECRSVLSEYGVSILGHNNMVEGSLVYKTREAGRKDGSGRIQRPW